jgi:hypothetical protein
VLFWKPVLREREIVSLRKTTWKKNAHITAKLLPTCGTHAYDTHDSVRAWLSLSVDERAALFDGHRLLCWNKERTQVRRWRKEIKHAKENAQNNNNSEDGRMSVCVMDTGVKWGGAEGR